MTLISMTLVVIEAGCHCTSVRIPENPMIMNAESLKVRRLQLPLVFEDSNYFDTIISVFFFFIG